MARPSKLTDKQWQQVEERHLKGEAIRALAKEFKIAESAIRERISAQTKRIKAVANQIAETDQALRSLPVSAQLSALTLAEQIKAVMSHMATAAHYGAMTSSRLAVIANTQAEMIDEHNPNEDQVRRVVQLQIASNESAKQPQALVSTAKDAVAKQQQDEARKPKTLDAFYGR